MTSAPTAPHQDDTPAGDGLAAEAAGFRFVPVTPSLPAGQPINFQFRITGAGGKPVTAFGPEQTKLMHFYLIRSDLTGFQHVHPSMSTEGTWTAPLTPAQPGAYRAYASFIVKDATGEMVPLALWYSASSSCAENGDHDATAGPVSDHSGRRLHRGPHR